MLNQKQMEEAKSTMLDYKEVVDKYVKVEDWRKFYGHIFGWRADLVKFRRSHCKLLAV